VRTRRTQVLIIALAGAAVLGVLGWGLPAWRADRDNEQVSRQLPVMRPPGAGERLLVLAPHCDDETLACGGILALAVRAGARTHVVLVTNGDGFPYAAERFFDEAEVPPKDYVRLGAERQKETLAALSELGVPAREVTFLGYPDGGSAHMWLTYWDPGHPYSSPRTLDNHNPYPNSLRPGGPYCGRFVLDDLETVIRAFKPTMVLCPDPNDTNRDHWALYCYTLGALYELGLLGKVRLEVYLVHRGGWPLPRGLHPGRSLTPPRALMTLGTRWEALRLDSGVAQRKYKAILRYRSQMLVMQRYLLSFARRSELFGEVPLPYLPAVAPGRIRVDGRAGDWRGIAPVIRDPEQDLAVEDVAPAGDLTAVYAARSGGRLFVRLDLYRPASRELDYAVHLHPLLGGVVGPPQTYILSPARPTPGVESRAVGRWLEMSVPLATLRSTSPGGPAFEGVMVGADSRLPPHLLDKTAWTLLRDRKP